MRANNIKCSHLRIAFEKLGADFVMHRSVRFVLQPYKSRNPPLAAVTQARRDANSGSYGYKAVVTKQPLNRGCPMPDIAHAPDQIGLLHENYPHVLAATFRFNAYFAHQAQILYYIFTIFSIAQIVKLSYNFTIIFMHTIQYVCNISQNSASA